MSRPVWIALLWPLFVTRSQAQGDLGVGLSVYHGQLYKATSRDGAYATPTTVGSPGLGVFVCHSESGGAHMNWYLAGLFTRRTFDITYGYAGLGGSYSTTAHVDLDLFYASLAPELKLDSEGHFLMRLGLMAGWKVGGRMTGHRNSWSFGSGSAGNGSFVNEPVRDFKGDLRLLFGFGIRPALADTYGLMIEPYVSSALSSLVKDGQTRGIDFGVVLGWYWKAQNTPPTSEPKP